MPIEAVLAIADAVWETQRGKVAPRGPLKLSDSAFVILN